MSTIPLLFFAPSSRKTGVPVSPEGSGSGYLWTWQTGRAFLAPDLLLRNMAVLFGYITHGYVNSTDLGGLIVATELNWGEGQHVVVSTFRSITSVRESDIRSQKISLIAYTITVSVTSLFTHWANCWSAVSYPRIQMYTYSMLWLRVCAKCAVQKENTIEFRWGKPY